MAPARRKKPPLSMFDRKDARHVGVNAEQLRRRLQAHRIHDDCAPIAALRPNFAYPRRFIRTTQARAMWATPTGGGRFS